MIRNKAIIDYKINEDITHENILIIPDKTLPAELNKVQVENKSTTKNNGVALAKSLQMDLIEVAASNDISICVLAVYDKYLYRLRREEQEKKQKSKSECKIARINITISPNDLTRKMAFIIQSLKNKQSVKIEIRAGTMPRYRFKIEVKTFLEATILPRLEEINAKYRVTSSGQQGNETIFVTP